MGTGGAKNLIDAVYQYEKIMSNKSQDNPQMAEIPGTISIMSRENTVHIASMMPDIWEFEHDPDDKVMRKLLQDRHAELKKRKSYQDIDAQVHLNSIEATLLNNQRFLYHSEMNSMPYEYNEYGLAGIHEHNYQDRKIIHRGRNLVPSRSGSGGSNYANQRRRKTKEERQRPGGSKKDRETSSINEEQLSNTMTVLHNRNFEIMDHKHSSNLNYLLRQAKELLFLNRLQYLQIECEQFRKKVMKLEIDCRKLKIGLRNSNSAGLVDLRRKEYLGSPKSKRSIIIKSQRGNASSNQEKEKRLNEQIGKEKKKLTELSTRESLINNYYNVIKNKKVNNVEAVLGGGTGGDPNPLFSQFSKIKATDFGSYEELKNYFDILMHHREIIKSSLGETEDHIHKKCQQISEETKILKKELEVIAVQIEKNHQHHNPYHNQYYHHNLNVQSHQNLAHTKTKSKLIVNFSKKQASNHNSKSSSKRKLLFKSPSHEENSYLMGRESGSSKLGVRHSNGEMGPLIQFSKRQKMKQPHSSSQDRNRNCLDPEKNEYYHNVESYRKYDK